MSEFSLSPAGSTPVRIQFTFSAEVCVGTSPPSPLSGSFSYIPNRGAEQVMGEPARSLRLFAPATEPEPERPADALPGQRTLFDPDASPAPDAGPAAAEEVLPVAGEVVPAAPVPIVRERFPVTLAETCRAALDHKRAEVDAGERSPRTLEEYDAAARSLLDAFGGSREVESLRPDDFARLRGELSAALAKSTLKKRIGMIRTVLAYAGDLRDEEGEKRFAGQVDYGRQFERPSAKSLRKEKLQRTSKYFEPEEVLALLEAAREPLRTMILLGVNCGFGNTDVATLPWGVVDFGQESGVRSQESGRASGDFLNSQLSTLNSSQAWIDFARQKTAIERRCPLWPETRSALKSLRGLIDWPDEALVFLTPRKGTLGGQAWVRYSAAGQKIDDLAKKFCELREKVGINRAGVGFYALRHCFETWAGESKDQVAVNLLMGHVDPSMAAVYREGISDERRLAVTDEVRRRLFGSRP